MRLGVDVSVNMTKGVRYLEVFLRFFPVLVMFIYFFCIYVVDSCADLCLCYTQA